MSKDSAYNQGAAHASQNKGALPPSSFKSDVERKAYQTGYNQNKK